MRCALATAPLICQIRARVRGPSLRALASCLGPAGTRPLSKPLSYARVSAEGEVAQGEEQPLGLVGASMTPGSTCRSMPRQGTFCTLCWSGHPQELLAMVPQPVLAVILCYPITSDSDAAAEKGGWLGVSASAATDSDAGEGHLTACPRGQS